MPETTVIDLVERCSQLERENDALQRLRVDVSKELAGERYFRKAAERSLRSCSKALACAAALASIEFVVLVGVILWLRGAA